MRAKGTEKRRRKYDSEFKAEVLKMVLNGRSVREVSESLGIGENLIYRWKSQSRGRNLAEPGGSSAANPGSNISVGDYERLQARLREAEQERDILKKALGIFSRGN